MAGGTEKQILMWDNAAHPEQEPEEEWLVNSGALQQLISKASTQSPVEDWERPLDEL